MHPIEVPLGWKSRFLARLAETSKNVQHWAVSQAFRHIEILENNTAKFGSKGYELVSQSYYNEAMRHESCSLCRIYGTENWLRTKKLAERYREIEVDRIAPANAASPSTEGDSKCD